MLKKVIMTEEEKAKAYDETLKRAKQLLETSVAYDRFTIEKIFPELKESEDEKIRKELIKVFSNKEKYLIDQSFGDITVSEALTWLEKQGEPNPYSGTSFKYNGHTWGMCARDNGVEILVDRELKAFLSSEKSFIYPIHPQPDITPKSAMEAIKEEKVDNQNCVNPFDYENANIQQKDFAHIEPKFHKGDVMRTLQEAADNIASGLPVIVSIDKEYYHCTNELIAIKDQDDYEYPPMNRKQNTADVIEPRFHEGDWVVRGKTIAQILDIQEQYYVGFDINGKDFTSSRFLNDNKIHLWSIEDAKDGDVLFSPSHNLLWIFKDKETYHISINLNYANFISFGADIVIPSDVCPATKEQRDLLFSKMKESGYEWNAEKKELKKIPQRIISAEAKEAIFNKPSWSEEDENMLKSIIATCKLAEQDIDSSPARHLFEMQSNWLKSIKARLKGE